MILFKRQFVSDIWIGRKTQTRRVGKKRWKVGAIHQARINYNTDPFALLVILNVKQERLGDITEADAKKEGCTSLEDFKAIWKSMTGRWDPDLEVWVVEFITIAQMIVNEWNSEFPVGTPVTVIDDGGEEQDSITTSLAWAFSGGGAPVINVEGQGGAYTLKRVKPKHGQFHWDKDKWWINAPEDPIGGSG